MSSSPTPAQSWFEDTKFGIFIHWTPASVPGYAPLPTHDESEEFWARAQTSEFWRDLPYAEQYLNTMNIPDSPTAAFHAANYSDLNYDAFAEQFRQGAQHWNPEEWADLFERSGAGYVVLVAKHLDGFMLWPSTTKNPHKKNWQTERDIVGELARAVRARGMKFGLYYSGGVDFTWGGLPFTTHAEMLDAVPNTPEFATYVDAHWRELIERYQPSILWNDMGYPELANGDELVEWYRKQVPEGVVNDRVGDLRDRAGIANKDFTVLEYQRNYARDAPRDERWQSCRGIGWSFGYNRMENDATYASSSELITELVEVVAAGGTFLLNVGPTGTGTIPWSQERRLLDIGRWLEVNGSAIDRSRRWECSSSETGEGRPVHYTENGNAVHAIVIGAPATRSVELRLDLDDSVEVTLPGNTVPLPWQPTPNGIVVELPESPEPEQPTVALRLSPAPAVRPRIRS